MEWNTGSQPLSDAPLGSGFQSVGKIHTGRNAPLIQVYRVSFHCSVDQVFGPQADPLAQAPGGLQEV